MKRILALITLVTFISCGPIGKVTDRQENGLFKASKEAKVIKSVPFDIDAHKDLLVVPNAESAVGMSEKIGYFNRVIKFEDFELEIIKDNKQEEVGSLSGKIGLSNAYRKYKPYLYLTFEANDEKNNFLQLKLINPESAEELFVAEIFLDVVWVGVTDKNAFNPLYNELIKYIQKNSKSYN